MDEWSVGQAQKLWEKLWRNRMREKERERKKVDEREKEERSWLERESPGQRYSAAACV